jgi:hypothetical protein
MVPGAIKQGRIPQMGSFFFAIATVEMQYFPIKSTKKAAHKSGAASILLG